MSRTTNETPRSDRLRAEAATDTQELVGERLACLDDPPIDDCGPSTMPPLISPFLTALLRALGAWTV